MDRASDFELDGEVENTVNGENRFHPLYGVYSRSSIMSTNSILSMLIAPGLHPEKPTQLDRWLDFLFICSIPPPYTANFIRNGCIQTCH